MRKQLDAVAMEAGGGATGGAGLGGGGVVDYCECARSHGTGQLLYRCLDFNKPLIGLLWRGGGKCVLGKFTCGDSKTRGFGTSTLRNGRHRQGYPVQVLERVRRSERLLRSFLGANEQVVEKEVIYLFPLLHVHEESLAQVPAVGLREHEVVIKFSSQFVLHCQDFMYIIRIALFVIYIIRHALHFPKRNA